MKTAFLQKVSHDAFGKYFDPAWGLVERTGDLCTVLLDAGLASVATGAQALSAPRHIPPRRWTSRHSESRRLDESKPFNDLFIVKGVLLEAICIPQLLHDVIHRQIKTFYRCAYFRISNNWKTARAMLTNGETMKRLARACVEFSHFLLGNAW